MSETLLGVFSSQRVDPPTEHFLHNAVLFTVDEQGRASAHLVYSKGQAREVMAMCEGEEVAHTDLHLKRSALPVASVRPRLRVDHPAGRTLFDAFDNMVSAQGSVHMDDVLPGILTVMVPDVPKARPCAIIPLRRSDGRCEVHVVYSLAHFREVAAHAHDVAGLTDSERLHFLERLRKEHLPEGSDSPRHVIDGPCGLMLFQGLFLICVFAGRDNSRLS